MRVEFPFIEEKSNLVPIILRPVAKVKIKGDSDEITLEMYVDSGADITLLSYSVGIALGFKIWSEEEIKTLGGVVGNKISVVIRKVKMKIGEKEFEARVAWCLSENVPLILGRLDVFERFKITFDQKARKVIFESKG